jgi:probable DNA repair protein
MSFPDLAAALAAGVTIVTPNKRLARMLVARHDAAMVRAGHRTWPAARALPWPAWLTTLCRDACDASAVAPGLRLLASVESRYLWDRVVAAATAERAPLLDPRGAAALAADAWDLVHAWGSGGESWRGWRGGGDAAEASDPATFAAWADQYHRELGRLQAVDMATVADVLAAAADAVADWRSRDLVLAGFIELSPQQRRLVDRLRAIGADVAEMPTVAADASVARFSAATPRDEIRAALAWARDASAAAPDRAIGIAIEDLARRRDEVRTLAEDVLCPALQLPGNAAAPRPYDFSLGIPLAETPIVGCALALTTLAQMPLPRAAAAALFRSRYLPGLWDARAQAEAWWLDEGRAHVDWEHASSLLARLDAALGERFRGARDGAHRSPQSPRQWATQWRMLLDRCGWPGAHALHDHEFAARNAWEELLEDFARIGAIDARLTAATALATMRDLATRTIFAPPSAAAAISIMGVLEAAGMPLDALWVAGLSAQRWPAAPQPNPFLPLAWQREHGVPRSTPARELDYARALTKELARSALHVVMSHPTTIDDQPSAASALIPAEAPPFVLAAMSPESTQTIRAAATMEAIADERAPALPPGPFRGGAGAIAAQSDCPFRATARYRLRVEPWTSATEGLNYMERGHLVHAAMAAFWRDVGSHASLVALGSEALWRRVDEAVDAARAVIAPTRWRLLPPAVAAAEASRIAAIGIQWIEAYERPRPAFVVTATEAAATLTLSGLTFNLRLDRIDTLDGGGNAIVDYKAGAVEAPKRWFAQRPRAPQLGLYALALGAITPAVPLRAVAYAKLKAGEIRVLGLAADDAAWPALAKPSTIGEPNTWDGIEHWWRTHLEALATELRDGVATVTPRDNGAPCRTCGFQPLCRIGALGVAINGDASDD